MEKVVDELLEKYGPEKSRELGKMILQKIEGIKKKEAPPKIDFGRPRYIKALLKAFQIDEILTLEEAWRVLNRAFGIEDKNRNLTISILDWNSDIITRVTEKRGDFRWRLTPTGKELASKLSDTGDLSLIEKTILSGFYLNNIETHIIYTLFRGQEKTRSQGIKEFAETTGESQKQAEWFIGEKTTNLVDLGLLRRGKKGRETVYY